MEVNFTSGSISKLEVYRPYEVPEIWMWQDRKLIAFAFENGDYVEIEKSQQLPELRLEWLEELASYKSTSSAIRELKRRLQD